MQLFVILYLKKYICRRNNRKKNNLFHLFQRENSSFNMLQDMMTRYLFFLFFFLATPVFAARTVSREAIKDSLGRELSAATEENRKLETLTNLMDICRGKEQMEYAYRLLAEARKKADPYYKEVALTEILRYYVNTDQRDSAYHYLEIAGQELDGKIRESLTTYMRMMLDVRIVCYTNGEEKKKILADNMIKLETEEKLSPFEKASAYYILGIAGNFSAKAQDELEQARENGFQYARKAALIMEKIPLRYSILFRQLIYFNLCMDVNRAEKAHLAVDYLKTIQDYAQTEEMKKRPYTSKRHMLSALMDLSSSADYLGKDLVASYYQQFLQFNRAYPEDASVSPAYERAVTSVNYYASIKEYKKAADYCDSTIQSLREVNYGDHAVEMYPVKIAMYDSLGGYKEAVSTYAEYVALLDTIYKKNLAENLQNQEIRLRADKLIVEKKTLELELQKSRSESYFFLALFVCALCAVFYIFFRLGKMKSLYRELQESNRQVLVANEKAQESEKMKNAFIRNMYHEVRTPLNAINGFSALIAGDEDLETEQKEEFSRIIHDNCILLTSMMDNVLKIAQLDSSTDMLPVEPVSIRALCNQEMNQLTQFQNKPDIDYRVEGDEETPAFHTHPTYFALVIARLLNNANKFTEKGSIVLAYHADQARRQMVVTVTDTGCGIPDGKHEWIFERFSKTNDFVPGTGLGLYLCRLIAERLDGSIVADPSYTAGARFVLTLPLGAETETDV